MFRPNPEEFAEQLAAALRDPVRLNLHAQAHARSILIELGTPRQDWPNFTADLDRRLHAAANYLLAGGIDLIESEPHRALARDALTRGAEALEFLVGKPQDGRLAEPMELLRAATAYHIADHHARSYVISERLEARLEQLDPLARMIFFLLSRRPRILRQATLDLFAAQQNRDEVIARQIALEEGNETVAVIALGERSLAGALSNYIEYLKTGREGLLETALDTTRKVTALASETNSISTETRTMNATLPSPSAAVTGESPKPEWLRLPAPGSRYRFTGLSRSTLNELTIPGPANDGTPPVKSVVLRKRGALRGIRLISYDSLMGYLNELV